jgi:hypothetical protein
MRRLIHVCALVAAGVLTTAGCTGDKPVGRVPAYLSTDDCSLHTEAVSCTADTANGCQWFGLGQPCPEGVDCPAGVCQAPDPCAAHGDLDSCSADTANSCTWAGIESLCPSGSACASGFCYRQGGDGCACACPLYCPPGADCPPCACDCPGGGGSAGGGTCTCACPECAPGQICPPCDCSCAPGDGCTGGDTCLCECPACPAGESCPPCKCACDGTPSTSDPCLEHTDSMSCSADGADGCTWIAMGIPCMDGQPCPGGVCQNLGLVGGGGTGGGTGCVCDCPACPDGMDCPPCGCDCTGTSGCIMPDPAP